MTPSAPKPTIPAGVALAGLVGDDVPERGTGKLLTVPGDVAAPGRGKVVTVRVQVEEGLPLDRPAFAAFVMATLNDPRSWGHGGTMTFARTDGPSDIRVALASAETSADLCRPLVTHGRLSCGIGDHAVLTFYRWVNGIEEYSADQNGYRRYVVNHEVGHTLGHHHLMCPGAGRPAPVMMQQTKGLRGCAPNSWPFP